MNPVPDVPAPVVRYLCLALPTSARWGKFPGGYRQAPWEGHFRNYRERDGIVVPTEGDVGWYVDDRCRVVWRGSVTAYEARLR